jgi:hypothetical protein
MRRESHEVESQEEENQEGAEPGIKQSKEYRVHKVNPQLNIPGKMQ